MLCSKSAYKPLFIDSQQFHLLIKITSKLSILGILSLATILIESVIISDILGFNLGRYLRIKILSGNAGLVDALETAEKMLDEVKMSEGWADKRVLERDTKIRSLERQLKEQKKEIKTLKADKGE